MHAQSETKNNQSEYGVYTVVRGKRVNDVEILQQIRQKATAGDFVASKELLNQIKNSHGNYSGAYCSDSFKVSTSINLIEIGFYGPFKPEDQINGCYSIHVEIYKSSATKTKPEFLIGTAKKLIKLTDAVSPELLCVGFQEPIAIQPNTWMTIQFKLDGPDTFRCESIQDRCNVNVEPSTIGNSRNHQMVVFDFLANFGSKQIPQIKFSLPYE